MDFLYWLMLEIGLALGSLTLIECLQWCCITTLGFIILDVWLLILQDCSQFDICVHLVQNVVFIVSWDYSRLLLERLVIGQLHYFRRRGHQRLQSAPQVLSRVILERRWPCILLDCLTHRVKHRCVTVATISFNCLVLAQLASLEAHAWRTLRSFNCL